MKYRLNKAFIRTTKNFQMNDIELELDLPSNLKFHDYLIDGDNTYNLSDEKDFKSEIGLLHEKYRKLDINIIDNDKVVKVEYEFNREDSLIDNININADNIKQKTILIIYKSVNKGSNFHNGIINVTAKNKSDINITILNLMSLNSTNIMQINSESDSESKVKVNIIDLGASKRVYRSLSNTYENSSNNLNMIYIGKNTDIIDINYNLINVGKKSNNNILVEGLLKDNSRKHFKGIIDFKKGSVESVGLEIENTIILSDDAISRSLPKMLCDEENVEGTHSASSGMIDRDKIYYLMTRGIDEKEAKKMLILSNFKKIIDELPIDIQENIINIIIDNL